MNGPDPGNRLFVYGTLLPGGSWWHVVEPWVVGVEEASCQGTLWDTGRGYPAATFDDERIIHGAVLELIRARMGESLADLDEFEDEYERTVVATSAGTAWAYSWAGPVDALHPIRSGRFVRSEG